MTVQRFLAGIFAGGLTAGLLVAAAPVAGAASGPVISTRVGGPGQGPALNVAQNVGAVAVSPGRTVYLGDQMNVVRQFTQTSTYEQVTAGRGGNGVFFSGDGGLATKARVTSVEGIAIDHAGNVVITDSANERVRVVAGSTGTFYGRAMAAGDIYTIAGNGREGYSGNGGPATSARLADPWGVMVDAAGNVVFADRDNNRLRVVAESAGTFYAQAMTAGDIYTIAGNGTAGFSGDGGKATSAELNGPEGLTVDGAGNVVVADLFNDRVRVVAGSSGTFYGQAMTAGHIYTVAGSASAGYGGDGGPATSARLSDPAGVTVDRSGNLVIADSGNFRVRVVAVASGTFYGQAMAAGDIYTVAGDGTRGSSGNGGLATAAELRNPLGVAFDVSGNLVIADGPDVRVVAESAGTFYGKAMTAGHMYKVAGAQFASSGNGGKAINAELSIPEGLTVTAAGDFLISDAEQLRMVPAVSGTYFGRAMTAGDIYGVAGTGAPGYAGDRGPATAARVRNPFGLTLDSSGNLIFADTGNARVRSVAAASGTFYGQAMTAGDIYTIAGNGTAGFGGDGGPATSAKLNGPIGVASDGHGNVVICDGNNNRIRVVAAASGTFYGRAMTAGDIYTIAGNGTAGFGGDGGPATSAEMWGPFGLAVDGSGNLVFADFQNNRVRVVAAASGTFYGRAMTAGDIYTIAGNGAAGFAGDSGPATSAELNIPSAVAIDSSGNVLIPDTGNNRVRAIAESAGTFYGQAMTSGDIYTVAGTGTYGESGDGGSPTAAKLSQPVAVAVDGAGDLAILDNQMGRIRVVTG